MQPTFILGLIGTYFLFLILIARITGRKADNTSFFLAGKSSPWYLVAFGMIGSSLSGVTFISIPGTVNTQYFSYMQLVLGYFLGYLVIIKVLLPLYYRMQLTSIYAYLNTRFGTYSHKTGASFFLLSRSIGSSFRLYLVAMVLDSFVLGPMGIPFGATVAGTILLIWLYTYRSGIKTIIWTDTLQTAFMLLAVLVSIGIIGNGLQTEWTDLGQLVAQSKYSQVFFWEWDDPRNFFKMFFSGAFITIVMTGLDQDMMQKNLSCRSLEDAQKNMLSFSLVLIGVNALFLSLGALLYLYVESHGLSLPAKADQLFPMLALEHFGTLAGVTFVIGLIAAAYSSADSALTAMTTSFCVDFLGFTPEKGSIKTRMGVHIGISVFIGLQIWLFKSLHNDSLITQLFTVAGYTYGPLLGLYAFGLFTPWQVRDKWVPVLAIIAPILCFFLSQNSEKWLNGYKFGFELLMVNGLLTFAGLWLIRRKGGTKQTA
ncbi:MAG: sodium:solute symporter [Sphingobacteriaceae bacterium]|nr:sodium:solute symporter [Sphingobacteriaceae bacterium]